MKKSIAKPGKLLILGLGNPGEQYMGTPHNAGFLTIDKLLETYNLKLETDSKTKSEIAETKIGKTKIILAEPQTFMNNSGTAAKVLVSSFKFPSFAKVPTLRSGLRPPKGVGATADRQVSSSLWVIHDDIDLELGKIKIVRNRGSGGHKGVEDIIKKLKTKDFVRFRVGTRPKRIPEKRSKQLMNKFVASEFTKSEQTLFKKAIKRATEAVLLAIEEGVEKSASIYNR